MSAATTDAPAVAASEKSLGEDARPQAMSASQLPAFTQPPTEKGTARESTDEYVDVPTMSHATVDPPSEPPLVWPDEPP